jgi:GPH family glycoside/pentoside/hexuronide:cation symporter
MLAYAPPIFGVSTMLFFVQFFFLKFATDVLLLAPAIVGLIFALGRLWDAVTDPLVGTWSDRTRTRLGRRRPWMLVGAPLLGLTFAMTYMPPPSLSGGALVAWSTVALFGFYAALTAYLVPHQALGAELTPDHHDRSRIFGLRHASFTLGMMLAFGGMQFVNNAAEPRAAAAVLVTAVGIVFSIVLLLTPWRVRERRDYQGRGAQGPLQAMRDVLQNPHARLLLFVQFIEMAGAGVLGVLSPFMIEYVLKRPDLIGPLPALFVICSIASIPVWLRLSRRFGKRNVWVASMIGFALSFGATAFVGANQWVFMTIVLVLAGISTGCGGAVGPSILADVIDYDEYETGERKEGAYSAAWGFAIKAANAVIILFAGLALQFSGFEPNAEQPRSAELTLRAIHGGLPFAMFLTGALLFRRFSLDEREHRRIRAELERRSDLSRARADGAAVTR